MMGYSIGLLPYEIIGIIAESIARLTDMIRV